MKKSITLYSRYVESTKIVLNSIIKHLEDGSVLLCWPNKSRCWNPNKDNIKKYKVTITVEEVEK